MRVLLVGCSSVGG